MNTVVGVEGAVKIEILETVPGQELKHQIDQNPFAVFDQYLAEQIRELCISHIEACPFVPLWEDEAQRHIESLANGNSVDFDFAERLLNWYVKRHREFHKDSLIFANNLQVSFGRRIEEKAKALVINQLHKMSKDEIRRNWQPAKFFNGVAGWIFAEMPYEGIYIKNPKRYNAYIWDLFQKTVGIIINAEDGRYFPMVSGVLIMMKAGLLHSVYTAQSQTQQTNIEWLSSAIERLKHQD